MPRLNLTTLNLTTLFALLTAMALAADKPAFEVASVKAASPQGSWIVRQHGGPGRADPDGPDPTRWSVENYKLVDIVAKAYAVEPYLISSPTPLEERFSIQAKLPAGTTPAQFLLMIQSLLEDRFHFRAHRQTRDVRAYELAVAKDGPKFQALAAGEVPSRSGGMTAEAGRSVWRDPRCTMERLRSMLARSLHAPVADRTGLTGTYDLELTWATEGRPLAEDPWPVRAALRDQLGLTLRGVQAPVETLVVDHVDRAPTGN